MLPTDKKQRKEMPIARGVLDYFPDAIAAVSNVSFVGNQYHNPGEDMHWARGKSMDHADCIARHLIQRGTVDEEGVLHSAKLAWRALALLQIELEQRDGLNHVAGFAEQEARTLAGSAKVRGTVYISGPMRGKPEHNFPAFDAARDRFTSVGYQVISPADMDRGSQHSLQPNAVYVKRDTAALLKCTHIAMLPGWKHSIGAKAEYAVARWLDLHLLDAETGEKMEWL